MHLSRLPPGATVKSTRVHGLMRGLGWFLLVALAIAPPRLPPPGWPPGGAADARSLHAMREGQKTGPEYIFALDKVPLPPSGVITPDQVDARPAPWPPASVALRTIAILALLLLMVRHRHTILTHLRAYLLAPDSALNLAVFRIVLFFVMAVLLLTYGQPYRLDGYPQELIRRPVGAWGPLVTSTDATLYDALRCVLLAACILAAIGLFTRAATVVATVLSLYVFGAQQSYFGMYVLVYHVVWFAAIMAASPCGDALSLDALLRSRRGDVRCADRSVTYGLPLRLVGLLIGLIYFFPGFWKLWMCGWGWVTGDTLQNIFYFGWMSADYVPPILPPSWVYNLAALWTVLFELSFIVMIFVPGLRVVAAVEGVLFLLAVYFFMSINFLHLAACHVVFFDWSRRLGASREARAGDSGVAGRRAAWEAIWIRTTATVGTLLIIGNIVCGVLHMRSWPFACYPTFAGFLGPVRPDLVLAVRHRDGTVDVVPDSVRNTIPNDNRWYAFKLYVLSVAPTLDASRRMHLFTWMTRWYNLARYAGDRGDTLAFYREWDWIDPRLREKNPISRETIAALSFKQAHQKLL